MNLHNRRQKNEPNFGAMLGSFLEAFSSIIPRWTKELYG